MPRINIADANHIEPSRARTTRARGANATRQKTAKQAKVAKKKQQSRSDHTTRTPSKQQLCLELLRRPDGANLEELQAATGWQPHSVRGFLSGTVKKKLGLTLSSDRTGDRPRRYRVASEA
jgi:hypothetical protein